MTDADRFVVTSALENPDDEVIYVVETRDPDRPWLKIRMRLGMTVRYDDLLLLRISDLQMSTDGQGAISVIEVLCREGWWQRLLDDVLAHVMDLSGGPRATALRAKAWRGYGWWSAPESDPEPREPDERPRDAFDAIAEGIEGEVRNQIWDAGKDEEGGRR